MQVGFLQIDFFHQLVLHYLVYIQHHQLYSVTNLIEGIAFSSLEDEAEVEDLVTFSPPLSLALLLSDPPFKAEPIIIIKITANTQNHTFCKRFTNFIHFSVLTHNFLPFKYSSLLVIIYLRSQK